MTAQKDLFHSLSVQPFWQIKKDNQVVLTDGDSGLPLSYIYEFHVEKGATALDCVPGIGLVGLLLSLDSEYPKAICCGALNKSKKVPLFGMSHVLSCQLFPGEFSRIFGVSSKELSDAEIPLEDIIKCGSFPEQLASAETFKARLNFIKDFLIEQEKLSKFSHIGKLTHAIVHDIMQRHGNVHMSELESYTGYSTRYLQQIFADQIGLAPKIAISNIRFQSALRMMVEKPELSLATIAQVNGYYDQSHFTKVFKEYTGMTPALFMKDMTPYVILPKEMLK